MCLLHEFPMTQFCYCSVIPPCPSWPHLVAKTGGKYCLWLGRHVLSKNLGVLILTRSRLWRQKESLCYTHFIWNFLIEELTFLSPEIMVSVGFRFCHAVAFSKANKSGRIEKLLLLVETNRYLKWCVWGEEAGFGGRAGMRYQKQGIVNQVSGPRLNGSEKLPELAFYFSQYFTQV